MKGMNRIPSVMSKNEDGKGVKIIPIMMRGKG